MNNYIIHFNDGNTHKMTAKNLAEVKIEMQWMTKYIDRIERVYKTGERATCPF